MSDFLKYPSSDVLQDLQQVGLPVPYSTVDGMGNVLTGIGVAGKRVAPYIRKITTEQFASGEYPFATPNGWTATPYTLPMLEPVTVPVGTDSVEALRAVEWYQIGNPAGTDANGNPVAADLVTNDESQGAFVLNLRSLAYSVNGTSVAPMQDGQTVVIHLFKESDAVLRFANSVAEGQKSNIYCEGLPDYVQNGATELRFAVTKTGARYVVTNIYTPDFFRDNMDDGFSRYGMNNIAAVIENNRENLAITSHNAIAAQSTAENARTNAIAAGEAAEAAQTAAQAAQTTANQAASDAVAASTAAQAAQTTANEAKSAAGGVNTVGLITDAFISDDGRAETFTYLTDDTSFDIEVLVPLPQGKYNLNDFEYGNLTLYLQAAIGLNIVSQFPKATNMISFMMPLSGGGAENPFSVEIAENRFVFDRLSPFGMYNFDVQNFPGMQGLTVPLYIERRGDGPTYDATLFLIGAKIMPNT